MPDVVNIGTSANDGTGDSLRASMAKINSAFASVGSPISSGSTTGRSLEDRFAEQLNVKDFGAKGDDSTDDTAAIQDALNAAAITGGVVNIPSGKFRCGGLTVGSNVRIAGEGTLKFNDNLIASVGAEPSAFWLIEAETGSSNIEIDGITFDGNISGQTYWREFIHCIKISDSSNVSIRNCLFTALIGDGIYISHLDDPLLQFTPYTGPSNVEVVNCSFFGGSLNRNGISVAMVNGLLVSGCYFSKCAKSDEPGAIDLETDNTHETIQNVRIVNNHFQGHAIADLTLQQGISINNNNSHGVVKAVTISGNVFDGNFRYPIGIFGDPAGSDFVHIQGNIIRNNTFSTSKQIFINGITAVVRGNTVENCDNDSIVVYSGQATIDSNNIIRAGHYAIVWESGAIGSVTGNTAIDPGCNGLDAARGFMYLNASGAQIIGNRVTCSDPDFTCQGIYQVGGTLNYIHGNSFSGISSKNFNFTSPGAQLWGGSNGTTPNLIDTCQEASLPPASGTFQKGQRIYHPRSGGDDSSVITPSWWECTESGTPGTWQPNRFGVVAAINFPNILAGSYAEVNVAVPGCLPADVVVLGIERTVTNVGPNVVFSACVDTSGFVAVKALNTGGTAVDLPSGTFKIMVLR